MATLSKRIKAVREKIERGKAYPIDEALSLLKQMSGVKFRESVDVSVNLGNGRLISSSIYPHALKRER